MVAKLRAENLIELAPMVGTDGIELQRIARALHRLDEASCNGYQNWRGDWDEAAEKRAERREVVLEEKAVKVAAEHGLKVYFQGDPRGWPLYLYRQDALDDYNARADWRPAAAIATCYDSVGVAVCPH